ncbi:uncharacterized protein [Amphiura filiformis]|uniref:uncharacterized protein n=1 Tax=Amphiura filiformis TaxID=82378 RepID=UPI003B226639
MDIAGSDAFSGQHQIVNLLKEILTNLKDGEESTFLSTPDCETLLQDEDATATPAAATLKRASWQDYQDIPPYPDYPLYTTLAHILSAWMKNGSCPILNLPALDLLEEGNHAAKRKDLCTSVTPLVINLKESIEETQAAQEKLTDIIRALGKRGLMDLLGMRQTIGSVQCFPPSRRQLEQSFNQQNKASSKLTVGARALAKHCHRDQTSSWWGQCTGSEQAKNEHATNIMKRILDHAAWINIHMLPHDVTILEVRSPEGYGARWSSDGKIFRGFLEPQMADGHEIGWKH